MKEEIHNNCIIVTAVGDIMLGAGVLQNIQQYGAEYPFEHVTPFFKNSDISFGNLEAPLTNETQKTIWDYSKIIDQPITINGKVYGSTIFCKSIPEAARGLNYTGFNVLSLANNHIMDYGEEGLRDTIHTLDQYNIESVGAGFNLDEARKPIILHINGISIGIIACCETYVAGNKRAGTLPLLHIRKEIIELKSVVDHVIVSIHQGIDISEYPNQREITLLHRIIDDGASIVLRHHAHVVQGMEFYKKGLILYSLGNFVFDYTIDPLWKDLENAKNSIIFKCHISKEGIEHSYIIPVHLNGNFQPEPLEGNEKNNFLKRFDEISTRINWNNNKEYKQIDEIEGINIEIILAYHALLSSIKKRQFRNILLIVNRIDKGRLMMLLKLFKQRLNCWW